MREKNNTYLSNKSRKDVSRRKLVRVLHISLSIQVKCKFGETNLTPLCTTFLQMTWSHLLKTLISSPQLVLPTTLNIKEYIVAYPAAHCIIHYLLSDILARKKKRNSAYFDDLNACLLTIVYKCVCSEWIRSGRPHNTIL